jgi:hypothetical protein
MPLFITAEIIQDAKREVRKNLSLAAKHDHIPGIKEYAESRVADLKQHVLDSRYLWDMGNWIDYKDIDEVRMRVSTNSIHWDIGPCIQQLKNAGVGKNEIVDLIMQNPHVSFNGDVSKIKSMLKTPEVKPNPMAGAFKSVTDLSGYSSDGSVKRKIKFKKAV